MGDHESTNPIISIITPCLNRRQFIAEAVESVLRQDYPNVEHIIIDGGSTDGTLEILNHYPHLRVISEPDKNLYDAINKGIRLAKGEIIGHLNSDDLYADNIFGDMAHLFQKHPETELVCGRACVFEDDPYGNRNVVAVHKEAEHMGISFKSVLLFAPIINAKFFRRSVYEKAGLYNTFYSITADKDFLLRLAIRGIKTSGFDKIVYYYRKHPGSLSIGSSTQNIFRRLKEDLLITEAYLRDYSSVGEMRYYCRRRHTLISLRLFSLCIRQRRYRELVSCALRGLKYDGLWPVCLLRYIL